MTVRLWDLPVRLVHWSFVALLPALWWTGDHGQIDRHKQFGTVMLGLVAFRLLWGLFGSATARFADFLAGPQRIIAYLRGTAEPRPGHNALGGWSVVGLLGLLAAQATIGLFAQDIDGIESGPLSYLVSYDAADRARHWHQLGFNLLLGLIALHLAAILYYAAIKRDNLTKAMITGHKAYGAAVVQPRIAPAWRVVSCAVIAAGLAWWISNGAPLPGK